MINRLSLCVVVLFFSSAAGAAPPAEQPYTWKNVQIVGGGFIDGILFHPAEPGVVYARTDIGGAYRLEGGAQATGRWVPMEDMFGIEDYSLYGVDGFAVDPADANRIYLAAGMYLGNEEYAHASVLRSQDRGRSWKRARLPFAMGGNENGRSIGERLAVDPNDGNVIYLGSRQAGLWRSTDGAVTWGKVVSMPTDSALPKIGVCFVLFDPADSKRGEATRTIYAAIASKTQPLYRSTDAGMSWQIVPGQTPGLFPHHAAMGGDGAMYLTYGNRPGPNDVTDGAVRKLDLKNGEWTDITPAGKGKGFGYAGLTIDAAHPGTVMVSTLDRWSAGDDIFRSRDGGKSWVSLKDRSVRDGSASPFVSFHHPEIAFGHWIGCVQIDPHNPDRAMYGTGATLWRTDNLTNVDRGQTVHWEIGAQGIEETAVLNLISPPEGAHLLSALGDIGGFRHDDLDASPPGGMCDNPVMTTTTCMDFAEQKPGIIVRVGTGKPGGAGAISHDGGTTWKPFAGDPSAGHGGGTVAISADGAVILWEPSRSAVYRSADGGPPGAPCRDFRPVAR